MPTPEKPSIARAAFVASLPVLMGYLSMGFAAGVLLAVKTDLPATPFWATLTSGVCISGALQFLFVDWIQKLVPLATVALLTLALNLRYAMYGLALLGPLRRAPFWAKAYLVWGLTDETYALETAAPYPPGPAHLRYCLLLTLFDHLYWIGGVTLGALAGAALPFDTRGIDFAMTALFLVILTDQLRSDPFARIPAVIALVVSGLAALGLGASRMLVPTIAVLIPLFLLLRPLLAPAARPQAPGKSTPEVRP
ncbi:MAG: AzlC family ABC transporter permease [Kiritimatiellae bacterium]|nr:AzlC family ABC transporter permease [Kiritimatiellia bacterium]MBQ9345473.1 AzlC family ABC transporter permease [Kiritimatiellia bacterium]